MINVLINRIINCYLMRNDCIHKVANNTVCDTIRSDVL
jgi:hypothetical protein